MNNSRSQTQGTGAPEGGTKWRRIVDGYLPILLVFTICVALWMVAMAIVTRDAKQKQFEGLESQAREIRNRIEDRLGDYAAGMHALRGHMIAVDQMTPEAWSFYYQVSGVEQHFPGAWGFCYTARVPDEEQDEYIERMRELGLTDFSIRPHRDADLPYSGQDRFVISFHGPENANQNIIGVDVGSYSLNREVYQQALETGDISVSSPIRLLQEGEEKLSVILVLPVFTRDMPTETRARRQHALRGWVALPIDFHALVQSEIGEIADTVGFRIQEADQFGGLGSTLFSSIPEDHDPSMHAMLNTVIVDKEYLLRVVPLQKGGVLFVSRSTIMVFVTGALVTMLFSTITWSLTRTRRKAIELAREMTSSIRKSEQRQRVLAVQATSASKAKSDFLANMSHEIRTPMTAILGYADLLGDFEDLGQKNNQFNEAVDSIQRSGKHLMMIINDVLDLSKIESGKLNVDMGLCDILDIVREIYSTMRMNAATKGLDFEVSFETSFPDKVLGDAYRIRQVLINLVGNAIKFTDSGSVKIVLEEKSDQLCFSVVDTGKGIKKDETDQLFRPFEQLDNSHTRNHEGTGLGLTISQHLADLMGGEITVDSVPGQGAIFTLIIPRVLVSGSVHHHSLDLAQVDKPHVSRTQVNGTGKILLAEDGSDNQRLISHLLKRVGYEVEIVCNGQEAIDRFQQAPDGFDVILMDMQMPVLDGYSATRQLRELGCPLPIIALTAHALQGSRKECMDAGCDQYISKPIDRDELYRVIYSFVDDLGKAA